MATDDVPGANPANRDKLCAGCWAEHADGSLLYVKGTENDQVVYELYDLAEKPPLYYQDAMQEAAFKSAFSYPPVGTSAEKWTWHDKTPFPWSRVMKSIDRPRPTHADVVDQLSAAAKVARSLRLRAQRVTAEGTEPMTEKTVPKGGRGIVERVQRAIEVLLE